MIPDKTIQETLISDTYSLHCALNWGYCTAELLELDNKVEQFIKKFGSLYPEIGAKLLKDYNNLNIKALISDCKSNFLESKHNGIIKKIRNFEASIFASISQALPGVGIVEQIVRQDRFSETSMSFLRGQGATLDDLQKILDEGPLDINACKNIYEYDGGKKLFSKEALIQRVFRTAVQTKDPKFLQFLLKNGATLNIGFSYDIFVHKEDIPSSFSLIMDDKTLGLMISRGLDINAQWSDPWVETKRSLLERAIFFKDPKMIQYLILRGANPTDDLKVEAIKEGLYSCVQESLELRQKLIHEKVREEMAAVPEMAKLSRDVLGVAASYIDSLSPQDLVKEQPGPATKSNN